MDHDHSYKNLFSHPKMVEDLLTGFVKHDWVQDLDFRTLEKLNSSYITDDLRERSDDVVWRLQFKGDQCQENWLYLYLLLEFQSTVDDFMAVRIFNYTSLLYQDLIKSKQLPTTKQLPPVLPIVLYNGERPWLAATQVADLLPELPDKLHLYQPNQTYLLIDEGRYSAAELAKLENLTAALIRAEIADSAEELTRVLANLIVWLPLPEQHELRRAFKEWITRLLLPKRLPNTYIEEVKDLTEVKNMLAERIKEWTKPWVEEGFKAGVDEGIDQGEARLLAKQLTKRFGPLPTWAEEKLFQAHHEQLEAWAEGIFDIETLEDFFTPPTR